jgi:hypothetical protein
MGGWGWSVPNVGQNPSSGSVIYYYFQEKPNSEVTLEFLDADGNLIKKFSSKTKERGEEDSPRRFFRGGPQRVTADKGMNRFVWNMRYPDAKRVPKAVLWGGMLSGPVAVPGTYRVKIKVGEESMTQDWEWKKDPRLETTQEEFQKQFDFLIKIRDKVTEVNQAIIRLRDVRKQIDDLLKRLEDEEKTTEIREAAKALKEKLKPVEDELIQSKSQSRQDPLNYPIKLDNKIAALAGVVASADARPTDQSYELFEELSAEADIQLEKLKSIMEVDILGFNKLVKDSGIPAIIVKSH